VDLPDRQLLPIAGDDDSGAYPSDQAAAACKLIRILCRSEAADFVTRSAAADAVPPPGAATHAALETALRELAAAATPGAADIRLREQRISVYRSLAQSGIQFCRGLDLEPYGSFVSGLFTPHGDIDLSIEGSAVWEWDSAAQDVDDMGSQKQRTFLNALASRIEAKRLTPPGSRVERITFARVRVPIIKFVDAASGAPDCLWGLQGAFGGGRWDWRSGDGAPVSVPAVSLPAPPDSKPAPPWHAPQPALATSTHMPLQAWTSTSASVERTGCSSLSHWACCPSTTGGTGR
jgi:hypothetical protein